MAGKLRATENDIVMPLKIVKINEDLLEEMLNTIVENCKRPSRVYREGERNLAVVSCAMRQRHKA